MDDVILKTKNLILTLILLQKIPKRFIHIAYFDLETPKLYKIKIKRNKKIHQLRITNFLFYYSKVIVETA